MIKKIFVFVMVICLSLAVKAKPISFQRSSYPGIFSLSCEYEVVDKLPEAEQEILFGSVHSDELLHEKFSTDQDRNLIVKSSSPAIKKWLGFIEKQMDSVTLSRVRSGEALTRFVLSSTGEVFVVGLRLEEQTLRIGKQVRAYVTIYGLEEEVSEYLLNFLRACFVEKTIVQKHLDRALLVGAGLDGIAYLKRDCFKKLLAKKSDGKLFEIYFNDYLTEQKNFPYTTLFPGTKVTPLRDLIGSVDSFGNVSGGLSFESAESRHDWVQWAFPSTPKSRFNSDSLETDEWLQARMKERKELQEVLLASFRYYLRFMGIRLVLEQTDSGEVITFVATSDFKDRITNYLVKTHNFMRTSRILTSLRLHGLGVYSNAFYTFLTSPKGVQVLLNQAKITNSIDDASKGHWRIAAGENTSK